MIMSAHQRERQRETQRETERERQRERDRDRDRQRQTHRHRLTDKQIRNRQTDKHRQTDRNRERWPKKLSTMDCGTGWQLNKGLVNVASIGNHVINECVYFLYFLYTCVNVCYQYDY